MTYARHPSNPVFSDTPTFESKDHGYTEYRTDVLGATDWRGNTFSVGDEVMYCIGAGHGQMMALGVIQQMRAREVNDRLVEPADHPADRVWSKRWDIEVQVLTHATSGGWNNEKRTRPAWVNPMNITALQGLANLPEG